MNIVVVHDVGVDVYRTWRDVEKNHSLKKDDFTKVGSDYICTLTGESYEVSKDVKLLERVASERVFAKQNIGFTDWCAIGAFIMSVLIYFRLG
ncbi:hypothetical protein A5N86_16645 [Geobacillus thermoleovorans]|uniref:hypothetical protein n=1 Tax=Geobacillus thermoleovorans TaxID=33941 RepID=UPI00083A475C|nr:hypothetical protein [Geobacillus thermoleovorans]ODA15324.1 hypothetical protein A5N86_16645 [Geobacillus thermoleovorans]